MSTTTTTKTIEVTVSPEGGISIKTAGFTGSTCKDATRDLEKALGVAGRESLLPEFYTQTKAGEQIRQGN